MKHIIARFILCAMFAVTSIQFVKAQTLANNETDSLKNSRNALVQVAYRKVPQSDLLGGVSVVNIEDLMKKNYINYSLDNMQGYVGGWNGASLWGMDGYLVLIDGVPREANNVDPSEIEHISFLKSASAVMLYGSRASKGVVYITTKRGKAGESKVNVRANTGYNVSKSYPKYLGAAEYMTLYNEARGNDGLLPSFTADQIYNTSTGKNPYRYADVDFYSPDYLKKAYNQSDVTAEISGGNQRARYYTNLGYYNQGDLFDFGQAKKNNVNRFNIRGNIDLAISDNIKAYVNANATFYNTRSAKGDYWAAASTLRPNRVTPLIPLSYLENNDGDSWTLMNNNSNIIDGKYFLGGSQIDQSNIFADYYAAGYNKWTSRQFQFDTGMDIDLKGLLKGLSFHSMFAVDYATAYTLSYNNTYAIYEPTWANFNGSDVIGSLKKYKEDVRSGVQNVSGSTDKQTIAFSGQFNYETSINKTHNISAILMAAGFQQTQSTVYHRPSNANLGLQLNYNYKNKYFVDLGSALVHSAKLASGHRNALSPSVSLGWKLNNEGFLANSSVVNDLSLSVSASNLNEDLDISDYYMYEGFYKNSTSGDEVAWWGWCDGASEVSTQSKRGANKDLDFVKRKEFAVTAKTSLWKNLISAEVSLFTNKIEGLIVVPESLYPSYFFTYYPRSSFMSYANYNNQRREGVDLKFNFNKRVGEVDLSLGIAATYYQTKATKLSELTYEYDNMYRVNKPVDGLWGLKCQGFYTADEVTAIDGTKEHPKPNFGGTVAAGDLKYEDVTGDGIIDSKDQVYLGKGGWFGAPLTTGVNLTAKYKNLTLFALGTGSFGAKAFKNSSYYWVYGDRKYSEVVRGRWTPETAETATYPRLTTGSSPNNFQNSDFWMYKTDRFNLAKVQITYDFPKKMLRNFFLHDISVYAGGSNLLTIAKERKVLELNTTSAPQARFYNVGFNVIF